MPESPDRRSEPEDVVLSLQERKLKKRMIRVLEALEAGHSRNSAAAMAGVSPGTVKVWVRKGQTNMTHPLYPWFHNEVSRSEGFGESLFADIVIQEATKNHNWRAAMFLLQKRYKWNDRPEMDNEIQREQQSAQLAKTKADTVYVEARTEKLKEDSDAVVLDRLRDILDEVREEMRPGVKEEQVN